MTNFEDEHQRAQWLMAALGCCRECGADTEKSEAHVLDCVNAPPPESPKKVSLPVLSDHAIKQARRCFRRYKYTHVLRKQPVQKAEALRLGSVWDTAVMVWWLAAGDYLEKYKAAIATLKDADLDPFEKVKIEEMLLGYSARWGTQVYTDVRAQVSFETELVNPKTGAPSKTYRLGGRLDGIATDPTGRRVILECKTSSQDIVMGSAFWLRVSVTDSQVSMYFVGAEALGEKVEACIYDVVRKPGQRPLKGKAPEDLIRNKDGSIRKGQRETDETPEEYRLRIREAIQENPEKYYARGELVRLAGDAADHAADTWAIARQIREAELANRYPRNPDSCMQHNRVCEYFDVCAGQASIDDPSRFKDTERYEVKEEIA